MNNKISKIAYIALKTHLTSPLIIGSGNDDNSGNDILKDYDGIPFIPGTSIAGVIRSLMAEIYKQDEIDSIFGSSSNTADGNQSNVIFYDAFPNKEAKISIRDGVKINYETKTAEDKGKYDYQIIEPGAEFLIRIECQEREKPEIVENFLSGMRYIIKNNIFRIGAKTTRGFGDLQINDVKIEEIDLQNDVGENRWIDFDWNTINSNINLDKYTLPVNTGNTLNVKAEFKIVSSMLVRNYRHESKVDTKHLTSGGKAVIPGTSLAGSLKNAMLEIMEEAEIKEDARNTVISNLFGFAEKDDAKKSRLLISESEVKNGKFLKITRNRIDRFTAGTVDTALFDEEPIYGGEFEVNIQIKDSTDYEKALLYHALRDFDNGIQALGGESSIGRGLVKIQKLVVNEAESYIDELSNKYSQYLSDIN